MELKQFNIVVGKPTTYPKSITYDNPSNNHSIYLEWCDEPHTIFVDYFLAHLIRSIKKDISLTPICKCRNIDLDDSTYVYLCTNFKNYIYIQVTDGLITLSKHKPIFPEHDYYIEFEDLSDKHEDAICEAIAALSYYPVDFIEMAGIDDNLLKVLMYSQYVVEESSKYLGISNV